MKTQKSNHKCPLLGAHFSIAKGPHQALYDAKAYQCTALQIFTKNSQTWKERSFSAMEVASFDKAREETGISEIASHTSYLINIATSDKKKYAISCQALKQEIVRSSALRIPYIVLHPGSHKGKGEKEGIRRISEAINGIFAETPEMYPRLLLEATAGQGTGIGHTFEQLAAITDRIGDKDRIGICLDTCHIFAAGYDIRTEEAYLRTMDAFHSVIGMEHLCLIHLNDSKKGLGSRVDRHEHIGEGEIGVRAFECLMNDARFQNTPKIIETPKGKDGKDWDSLNLERLRALVKG